MITKNNSNHIPGNYQYLALHSRGPIQGQWHKNRHNLLKFLEFFDHADSVLDLGCGSGNIVLEFAPFVRSITGVDNNKECVLFLKNKIKEMKLTNAEALKMDLLKLDLGEKRFSRVIITEVLEHFDQEQAKIVMQEIKKILIPKGRILVTTPNYRSPWPLMEYLIDKTKLTPRLWGEQHLTRFTKSNLIPLLEKTGFGIERIGTVNTISPFIAAVNPALADKLSYVEFRFSPIGNLLYCVASLS